MAFNFGGKIVRDGLVMYLDAGNRSSYIQSDNVWNDLSRNNNNVTLINGPTFDNANWGSIVFDGLDDYASRNSNINVGDNFSVFSWIKPTNTGFYAIVANASPAGQFSGWHLSYMDTVFDPNTFVLGINNDSSVRQAAYNSIQQNTWSYIGGTAVNGGGNIILYINGVEVSGYSNSFLTTQNIPYTINEFSVGVRPSTIAHYIGSISQISIYNRALSPHEVLQNYNALKGRYGL